MSQNLDSWSIVPECYITQYGVPSDLLILLSVIQQGACRCDEPAYQAATYRDTRSYHITP